MPAQKPMDISENSSKAKDWEDLNIPETSSIKGIRYLTCQGGGMKGIGDVSALEELERAGVINQLEAVAGTSVGSFVALVVAIGCTTQEIRTELVQMDFLGLQDRKEPGWVESMHLSELLSSMEGPDTTMEKKNRITKKKKTALQTIGAVVAGLELSESAGGLLVGGKMGLWEGDVLAGFLQRKIVEKTGNPNLTFKELETLANEKGLPFKKLILTGSNLTDQKLHYFNAEETPDMPIALAARISGSFPGGFKPVKWKDPKDGVEKLWIDGGLLENLPDVFNKEPYISEQPKNAHEGNPRAFALSFDADFEKKPKKEINTFAKEFGAMVGSLTNEQDLMAKYEDNIAYVKIYGEKEVLNPKTGMMEKKQWIVDTMDFAATEDDRKRLADSGQYAVRDAFKKILAKENQKEFKFMNLPVDELMRVEATYQEIEKPPEKVQEDLLSIRDAIAEKTKNMPEEEVVKLRAEAKERYDTKRKLDDPKNLSMEEALRRVTLKKVQLDGTEEALKTEMNALILAQEALKMQRDVVVNKYKDEATGLKANLSELAKIEKEFNEQRLVTKDNVRDQQIKAEKNNAIDQKIDELIDQYKEDPTLSRFFTGLKVDSRDPDFKFSALLAERPAKPADIAKGKPPTPVNPAAGISKYCYKDIKACMDLLVERRQDLSKSKKEREILNKQIRAFNKIKDSTVKFGILQGMVDDLDKAILRKTGLIAKIEQKWLKKAPQFKGAITAFTKTVAALAFVAGMTGGLGFLAVPIAKLYQKFHPDSNRAKSWIRFYKMADLNFNRKLHGLRDATGEFLKIVTTDFVKGDKAEETYLIRLYGQMLKNAGVPVGKVFTRNKNETETQYKARITAFQAIIAGSDAKFFQQKRDEKTGKVIETNAQYNARTADIRADLEAQDRGPLVILERGKDERGRTIEGETQKEFQARLKNLEEKALKAGRPLPLQKFESFVHEVAIDTLGRLKRESTNINWERLLNLDEKLNPELSTGPLEGLQVKRELTAAEQVEYVELSRKLNKDLSPAFIERHGHQLKSIETVLDKHALKTEKENLTRQQHNVPTQDPLHAFDKIKRGEKEAPKPVAPDNMDRKHQQDKPEPLKPRRQ